MTSISHGTLAEKTTKRVWNSPLGGDLAMPQKPTLTMRGNPNKTDLTKNSDPLIFRFTWPTRYVILNKWNAALTNVGQPQKRKLSIEKNILGWKPTNRKVAFQSNFKFYDGDTLKFSDSWKLKFIYTIEFTVF